MVDVVYSLDSVQLRESPDPYIRFRDLLPISTMQHRLPPAEYTPLVHATHLGERLGLTSLYLKNETVLPTSTTKDRMAAVSLAYLYQCGVRTFCTSSTGNSSTSFVFRIRAFPDMHIILFTAEDFVARVQHAEHRQVTHYGMRNASFVEAAEYASRYAREHKLTSEAGFFNPGRREGLKLAFLEASEQAQRPIDWYVQAVSSAMGVYGAYKGAKELQGLGRLHRLPRLLCVQQETCAPMARAFLEGSETIRAEHRVARPAGIAEAILRGDPTRAYPYIRHIVKESGGTFVTVSEGEIRQARRATEELEGISPCFSAAAAVAGVMRLARNNAIRQDEVVIINLTGGDRHETSSFDNIRWLDATTSGWNAPPPAKQDTKQDAFGMHSLRVL